jgi:glycosyltransferase involved in cell wall biosynthesis
MLIHDKPDAILLYGIPTIGVQTLLLARKRRVPVVCRAIDVTHELVPNRLLVPFTHLLAKYVYTRADLNVVVTPHLKSYVRSYGVTESRIRLLPSGVDREMFSPGRPSHDVKQALGISPDQRVILFMGTMYRFSGLDRVIRGFPQLIVKFPNTKLVIAGSGEDEDRLKQLARECGIDSHVIFAGLLPYVELPDLIRTSDVCINPFELNAVTERILPTKLFQYLSCGKPVVATELPGTIPFLKGEEQGIVHTQPENFLSALMKLLADPERMDRLGKNGAAAVGSYGWREIAEKVEDWINELRQTTR